jgi:hypothetical protein
LDLYCAVHGVELRTLLDQFRDAPEVTDEVRVARLADSYRSREGKYMLACERCPSTKWIATELDAAIVCDGGSAWEVAPDGIAALCPTCTRVAA